MRRKLSLAIAFIGVLGLIGLNPAAQADHDPSKANFSDPSHDARPTPPTAPSVTGACLVQGVVNINQGVDATPRHNHYRFRQTTITCQGLNENYNRSFGVDAAGGTDGPGNPVMSGHGEDDAEGWSHKSCYVGDCAPVTNKKGVVIDDLYDGLNRNRNGADCWNCGEIIVQSLTDDAPDGEKISDSPFNFVMFHRVGNLVTAWGALTNARGTDGDNKNPDEVVCFLTELEFTPTNPAVPGTKPIDEALLTGVADIWITTDKDDCMGTPGGKKGGA